MEELIRQIHEMPIDDFEQQLHIHLSGLKKETDKLKIFIVLLLLAQKSLDVIKEMDLDDIIHQLKKKSKQQPKNINGIKKPYKDNYLRMMKYPVFCLMANRKKTIKFFRKK